MPQNFEISIFVRKSSHFCLYMYFAVMLQFCKGLVWKLHEHTLQNHPWALVSASPTKSRRLGLPSHELYSGDARSLSQVSFALGRQAA